MRVITIFNHKGGCGKTTTAINLAGTLANADRRVLLADLDPQAHATIGCGVREEEVELSTWDVLGRKEAEEQGLGLADIAWEIYDRFYLAPATVGLATLEQTLAGTEGREHRLALAAAQADGRYDAVVVDCGPGLGLLSINALWAATEIIVPVDLGFFSLHGLARALETVDVLAERTGVRRTVHILPTMYDSRVRSMREALAALREQYGPMVLASEVRLSMDLRDAAARGSPISEFLPDSGAHEDYRALAQELLAADLQLAFEEETRRDARRETEESKDLEARLQMVYGAVPIEGGVRFVCHAPGARRVQVAGDFNRWNAADPDADLARTEVDGVWHREFHMPPGRYTYRLVIDGRWSSDPANPYVESNPYGELNSVVEVG
ncbi:MAG: AAA family ATPase [Phycisphaerae bacterium]